MNVEIGTETPIFLFWEYLFRNFGILSLECSGHVLARESHTVQTLDLILPCIRRIPKMHFWIEHKILLQLLLCILGLFLPTNFTLSFYYPGSEGTRFESRVRINGEYFSQLLSMNKTHTFNTIHIFWFISHCEKDFWTKVKCRASHQASTHCLCDIILYYSTSVPPLLMIYKFYLQSHLRKTDTCNIFCPKFICLRMGASLYKYFCFFHSHTLMIQLAFA